jgi:hypothetical protein
MSQIVKRWPIHPVPYVDESLFSWIIRIAKIYEVYPEDLLKYEFDIELEVNELYIIDINPPVNLLDKLSQYTGIDVSKIRTLTAHSYVPLLIDAVEPLNSESEGNPNSFSDYVNQFNIFPRKRNHYYNDNSDLVMGSNWIPWFDSKHFVNTFGCEACLKKDKEPYLRLYWRFPWMMTCPFHKQLLKQVKLYSFTNHIEFYFMQNAELSHSIDNLCIIDEITLQAVIKGFVKTPAGYLHGGVWLRLLRSLIEELSLLQKNFSQEVLNVIRSLWKALGLFWRDGFYRYKVFEECDGDKQLILMLIASSALQSIFNNQIKFSTNGIKLLTPELIDNKDLCSVYPGYITKPEPLSLKTIDALMDDVLTSMRSDPKVVIEFRNIIKAFDKSGKSLASVDKNLKELGIQVIDD